MEMNVKIRQSIYVKYIKPFMSISISIGVLIIAIIPMIIVAALIKIESKGPIIFKQKRIGKNGKVFEMYKFRSMIENAEYKGSGVYSNKNDSRVTKIGRIIRATSIDELPQLFNVIKGEMALIGPRAPLTYHPWKYEEYTEYQKKMFSVKPGFSGWAQIHGRKELEWSKRIEMNVWYAENISLLLDIKIILITIVKVITNEGNENIGITNK